MKTLLILRHAKTQSDSPRGDWERRLTGRGERDAAAMGRVIGSLPVRPDAVVTSDAVRARQTAEIVAEAGRLDAPVTLEPRIYGAEVATLRDVVRGLPDDADRVLIVGHNPGCEELAATLMTDQSVIDHLPTAGLVHISFDVSAWRDVRPGTGQLHDIFTPKAYQR